MTCAAAGCDRTATRRGLCPRHYMQHWQRGLFDDVRGYSPARPAVAPRLPDWVDAACRGRDDIDWVPDREHLDEPNTRAALKVCAQCVRRLECAEWAITNSEAGFWGGLTSTQRVELRRDRRAGATA